MQLSLLWLSPAFTTTEARRSSKIPLWLWPNLLSLDAPCVAVLWQILLARALHVHLGWEEPLILFLAVWIIYIADRVFDSFRHPPPGWEPERKKFYRAHPLLMSGVGATAGLAAFVLVVHCLRSPSILCSGLVLGLSVLCYFTAVHIVCPALRSWPRELVVALIFSIGTFAPVILPHGPVIQTAACSALFSLLCWVNCALIETAEWRHNPATRHPGSLARFIDARVERVLALTIVAALLLTASGYLSMLFCCAVAAAALALYLLARRKTRISAHFLRVAADGALCSPLIVLLIAHFA